MNIRKAENGKRRKTNRVAMGKIKHIKAKDKHIQSVRLGILPLKEKNNQRMYEAFVFFGGIKRLNITYLQRPRKPCDQDTTHTHRIP